MHTSIPQLQQLVPIVSNIQRINKLVQCKMRSIKIPPFRKACTLTAYDMPSFLFKHLAHINSCSVIAISVYLTQSQKQTIHRCIMAPVTETKYHSYNTQSVYEHTRHDYSPPPPQTTAYIRLKCNQRNSHGNGGVYGISFLN